MAQTKLSRMAIVIEPAEGDIQFPASGLDFLALQEGFSSEIGQDSLDNPELKGSLGVSKQIPGLSTASASLSHVLRHSGTEGIAPQAGYSAALQLAFGSKFVAGTEYNTIAGSTTLLIKMGVGVGANFRIGQGMLIKHSAFQWEIAVIKSISGDDIVPLFKLKNAPIIATPTGKAIHYQVSDAGVTGTIHDYRGNGDAYALLKGMRCASMSIAAAAADILNASFEFAGIDGLYDPIRVTATDTKLDIVDDGTPLAATIAVGVYRSPIQMASVIQDALNALGSANLFVVSYNNSTGKFTISSNGITLALPFATGPNAANSIGDKIGFSGDLTGSLSYIGAAAIVLTSPYTPSFDSPGDALVVKNNEVMFGDQVDNECVSAENFEYTLEYEQQDVLSICAESGKSGTLLTSRAATASMTVHVPKYKADWFEAMKEAAGKSMQFNFGPRINLSYQPGKSGAVAIKDCTIVTHNLGDSNGLVVLEIEVRGFVDSNSNPETGLNLL